MVRGAATGRAVIEATRVLFDHVQKRFEVCGLDFLGVDHQHLGHAGQQGQRDEVALQVIVQSRVHGRRNHMVGAAHEEVVAVRRQLGRVAGAQGAACAATVVDHQGLSRALGELGRERPGKGIGAAAGRKRHDQVHGFGRPVRRGAGCHGQGQRGQAGAQRPARQAPPGCADAAHSAGSTMFWSMAPKMLWPSLPFISMRMVSPKRMNSVLGAPSWMVSMQRFSAMQL